MEITCHRCHQAVPEGSCFCPSCGLPQLVYPTEEGVPAATPERWTEAMRDAGQVEWKAALRVAAMLAIPAGLLASALSPLNPVALFSIGLASSWAVSLYVRRQKPSWITTGAGARIGLVTGLLAGWLAFCGTGVGMYSMRFLLHEGKAVDQIWLLMNQSLDANAQIQSNPEGVAFVRGILGSPQGRAGFMLLSLLLGEGALLIFAAAGGAIGARMVARSRRPGS